MLKKNRTTSFLYGGNAPYIEELYEMYLADPGIVPVDWKRYFDALQTMPAVDGTSADDIAHGPVVDRFVQRAKHTPSGAASSSELLQFGRKQAAVQSLVAAYRMVGTRKAKLDPLAWAPVRAMPDLAPDLVAALEETGPSGGGPSP